MNFACSCLCQDDDSLFSRTTRDVLTGMTFLFTGVMLDALHNHKLYQFQKIALQMTVCKGVRPYVLREFVNRL